MEKCGQEKFKKLINSMKITPNKLKSIIRETIDELRTMGDMQGASLLDEPTVARHGAYMRHGAVRQARDDDRQRVQLAPIQTKMNLLKRYIATAFEDAGFLPQAQNIDEGGYPGYETLEKLFREAIEIFKQEAAEKAAEAEGQQQGL